MVVSATATEGTASANAVTRQARSIDDHPAAGVTATLQMPRSAQQQVCVHIFVTLFATKDSAIDQM
jgi:hypothetical protein